MKKDPRNPYPILGPGLPRDKPKQPKQFYDPPVRLTCRGCGGRYFAYLDHCPLCATPKPVEPKK